MNLPKNKFNGIVDKPIEHHLADHSGLTDSIVSFNSEGKKYLAGKPDWSLVPMDFMAGVVRVFEYGQIKYNGKRTWLPGIRYSLLFSAIMRHLIDWFFHGKNQDEDSGEHPLCHVIANCLMLLTFIDNKNFDDRG